MRAKDAAELAFFDVDTQHDFMSPGGALYVRGARTIAPTIRRLVAFAARKGIRIFSSTDAHTPDDPELQQFAPHCIVGTWGQGKIPETLLPSRGVVSTVARLSRGQLREILQHPQVVIEKQAYDVFTNPNTVPLLRASGARRFVVFGVATDYCVRAAVLGLCRQGYKVTVASDAIRGISRTATARTLAELRAAGARFKPAREIIRMATPPTHRIGGKVS